GAGFHRRRIPAHRAAATGAVARRSRTAAAGRSRHLRRAPPAGARRTRALSGNDAPRCQSSALRPPLHPRHHLPRCGVRPRNRPSRRRGLSTRRRLIPANGPQPLRAWRGEGLIRSLLTTWDQAVASERGGKVTVSLIIKKRILLTIEPQPV